jgi:hypothetical protein
MNIQLIAAGVVLVLLTCGFFYIKSLRSDVALANNRAIVAEQAVKLNEETIKTLGVTIEERTKSLNEVIVRGIATETENNVLKQKVDALIDGTDIVPGTPVDHSAREKAFNDAFDHLWSVK